MTHAGHNDGIVPIQPDAPPGKAERIQATWHAYFAGRPVPIAALLAAVPDARWIDRSRLSRKVTLTIARSWTIENVLPALTVLGAFQDLDFTCHLRPFGVLQQEILNTTSPLYTLPSDYLLLLWKLEDFLPDAHTAWNWTAAQTQARIDGIVAQIMALLERVVANYHGTVVCFDFGLEPLWPQQGILEAASPWSPANLRQAINTRLRTETATVPAAQLQLLSLGKLQYRVGFARWPDERLRLTAGCPFSVHAQLAVLEEVVNLVAGAQHVPRKILLLDGDNTLWGGILAEDGPEGIQLGAEYPGNVFVEIQKRILQFHGQGVALGLCSKNREEDIRHLLAEHPAMILRPDQIAVWEVNWRAKSDNIRAIAERLNLGLDAFVFVDDAPQEREEVRQRCPGVLVPEVPGNPMQLYSYWLGFNPFPCIVLSREDQLRTRSYQAEEERRQLRSTAPSLESFYYSLKMKARLRRAGENEAVRLAQLSQRTNQFNATTIRMTVADAVKLLRAPEQWVYLLELDDRFGESGVVGCAVVQRETGTATVFQFMMSCRVLQRTVEQHFLGLILQDCAAQSQHVCLRYTPSAKNGMVLEFFRQFGEGIATPAGTEWTVPTTPGMIGRLLQPWIDKG